MTPPYDAPKTSTLLRLVPLPGVEEGQGRPTPPDGYDATAEQRLLKDIAIEMVADGVTHPVKWMAEFKRRHGQTLPASRFTKWKQSKAFEDWFYEDLVYTPTERDEAVAKTVWARKLDEGVKAGNLGTMDLFARTKGLVRRAGVEQTGTGSLDDLLDLVEQIPDETASKETTG